GRFDGRPRDGPPRFGHSLHGDLRLRPVRPCGPRRDRRVPHAAGTGRHSDNHAQPGRRYRRLAMTRPGRLAAIDWLRGVAVTCMVIWHVTDAWHTPADRDSAGFAAVIFVGGWAAPMFVFLAGLSLVLAAGKHLERGASRVEAASRLRRRGWQIFILAHVFRLQSFLLDPYATWDSIFKADILNVLGLGIVAAGWAWQRADSGTRRVLFLLVPALVIGLVLTPWAPLWQWPSHLPARLEGYVRISGDNAVFSLFPAVGYVLAGAFV